MHEEIKDSVENILESIILIEKRFIGFKVPEDFVKDDIGLMALDSIAMRLQVIGENVKNIFKIDSKFLKEYSEIEWKNIMKLRDVI